MNKLRKIIAILFNRKVNNDKAERLRIQSIIEMNKKFDAGNLN